MIYYFSQFTTHVQINLILICDINILSNVISCSRHGLVSFNFLKYFRASAVNNNKNLPVKHTQIFRSF